MILRRDSPEWPFEQRLVRRLPVPRSKHDPLRPNLADADVLERHFLSLSDETWGRVRLQYGNNGQPLVSLTASGEVVIHDPWLAEIDALARRNAGL